jgi:Carboxypeptidase regulatory-like domain
MKSAMRWGAACLSVLLVSLALMAQDTASLTGTVRDPSGANIANAHVKVSSPERGIERATTSNDTGDWLVPALPPGSYNLDISAPGFKEYHATGIILRVAQKARADAALQVGSAATEVTVQGTNVAQVETQSSELAGTVTGKEITQLQLNGRSFTQLVTLTPGVSNQTGQLEGQVGITANVAFSVNGGRTEYNNWELDGGDNMDNGSNTTLNVYPSVDAISEFRVLTSNYGAQYGRNGSGTVETEIKSGTSRFHGSAYEFVRNDAFNARNFFQSEVPPYKKNDWGYTVGGPVYIPGVYNTDKQKTFFFFSEEWRRDRVPGQTFSQPVPSVAERSGNFSDLCPNPTTGSFIDCPINPATNSFFPGNQVAVDPAAGALLGMIPEPNAGVPGNEVYNAAPSQPTNWREELFRIDHNFSPRLRGMFHYIHDSWDTVTAVPLWTNAGSFPSVQTNFVGPAVSMVARLTATVSPTLLNEFVMSYTTDHITLQSTGTPDPNAWKRPAGLPMGALFNNGFGGKLPGFSVAGNAVYGSDGFGQDPGYIPNGPYNSNPTYTLRDNVSKSLGRHNLQFGAYAVFAQKNELSGNDPSTNGFLSFDTGSTVTTGNAFADLLTGRISSFQQQSSQPKYYNRYKIVEPYFQDDWRVNDRLTLNLGLRLSLFGTYRERFHQAFNFDPRVWDPARSPLVDVDGSVTGVEGALIPGTGAQFNGIVQCGVNGVPAGCMTGHLFNPAPRVGFAYDPKGNGKTAIRGGYGIFFEHTNGNEANSEALENSPPLVQSPTQVNILGYTSIGGSASGQPLAFPANIISIPTKAIWPYYQQWHLDLQHELVRNTVLTLSYVGSKGTHLGRQVDMNQIPRVPLSANPYKPGEPIGGNIDPSSGSPSHDDCGTGLTPSGVPVPGYDPNGLPTLGTPGVNLFIACGNDPNPFRPFRGYGDIRRLDDAASSTYQAFQASARHNVGGLQLSVAYSYSHAIDDSSSGGQFGDAGILDAYHPSAFRASSNFDQRHLLNVSYVYDLPFFRSPGLAHTLLGGWQYSGITTWQTGTPFSVYNSTQFADNAGLGNGIASSAGQSYADLVGDPNGNITQVPVEGAGPLVYNPAAFAAPRGLTLGDSGRNILRNPRHTNFDMALFKHFAIRESAGLEFRAEAFNIFNHTSFGPLGGDAGSAAGNGFSSGTATFSCYGGPANSSGDPSCLSNNFLHTATAYNARILQLGLKLLF